MYKYDIDKLIWSNVDCDFGKKNLYGFNSVKYYTQYSLQQNSNTSNLHGFCVDNKISVYTKRFKTFVLS